MKKNSKIYIAGHRGLVGSAIVRNLQDKGYNNLVTRTHSELDLTNQAAVHALFWQEKPEYVVLAAAKVGGIHANNTYRAEFIYSNIMVQSNVIDAAYRNGVKRLLFLGSSCVYPRDCPQPMKEDDLLTGPLEKTNEPYAVAKIAGIRMCDAYNDQYGTDFVSVMPTNLYGPGDNFDLDNSHVLPALLRKTHEAKILRRPSVAIWGTGSPLREFMYVDDMADACVHVLGKNGYVQMVNIGTGEETSILQLAKLIKHIVGYHGAIVFDTAKPDGTPRKLLDCSRLQKLGWKPPTGLKEGIKKLYRWYLQEGGAIHLQAQSTTVEPVGAEPAQVRTLSSLNKTPNRARFQSGGRKHTT